MATGGLQQLIVSHVYDIVGAAITSVRASALIVDGFGVRATRLGAMRSHILANLNSPQLSVAAVAAHQQITLSSLRVLVSPRLVLRCKALDSKL